MEEEAFEKRVDEAWNESERSRKEDEGGDCAMFGFEAFEERNQGEEVEEEVEEGFVDEREGVESVYC